MGIFRRRPAPAAEEAPTPREAALADARRAAASLRRRQAKAERYRSGKQGNPVETITVDQFMTGGS